MRDNETGSRPETAQTLPRVIDLIPRRPSYARLSVASSFVSQLIAERDHLPTQRQRRRTTPEAAALAYGATSRMTIRRMPAGYRTAVEA